MYANATSLTNCIVLIYSLIILQWTHPMKSLDSVEMRTLVHTTPEMHQYFNETLKKILVVRVPGTDSHRRVKEVSID